MKKRNNFTLVEIAAVLLIAAILVGLATPVFRQLFAGNAKDKAARELAARIAHARSYAISRHAYTAVIFPKVSASGQLENGTVNTSVSPDEYANCSYRLAMVYKNGDDYEFLSWFPDSKWYLLPKGIIIPCKKSGFDYFGFQTSTDRNQVY